MPQLGASRITQPTYCLPLSHRSWPLVPGHSAATTAISRPPTHTLQATEPQELAIGPWPPRLDLGRGPYPTTTTAGRRAAGVRPWSLAAAPRPRSSSIPHHNHCRPPSRRSSPLVLGRRASTSVVVHTPPQPMQAAEPQEFALGPWPPRLDLGHRPSLTPPQLLLAPEAQKSALGPRPLRLDQGLRSYHAVASSGPAQEPKEEAAYHFEYRGPRPDCPPELWSPTSAHRTAPCGPHKRPQPLTVLRQPPTNGPAS